jgi:hypothetical protein
LTSNWMEILIDGSLLSERSGNEWNAGQHSIQF